MLASRQHLNINREGPTIHEDGRRAGLPHFPQQTFKKGYIFFKKIVAKTRGKKSVVGRTIKTRRQSAVQHSSRPAAYSRRHRFKTKECRRNSETKKCTSVGRSVQIRRKQVRSWVAVGSNHPIVTIRTNVNCLPHWPLDYGTYRWYLLFVCMTLCVCVNHALSIYGDRERCVKRVTPLYTLFFYIVKKYIY